MHTATVTSPRAFLGTGRLIGLNFALVKVGLGSCVRQVQLIGHGNRDWFTQVNNNTPFFDRQDHPFVPTCLRQSTARSVGQRQSKMPPAKAAAPAQPARSVLDRASTVLG